MWRRVYIRDWIYGRIDYLVDRWLQYTRRWMADNAKRDDLP